MLTPLAAGARRRDGGLGEDREFQRKTNALVQMHISTVGIDNPAEIVAIDQHTIEVIKQRQDGPERKVINL